MMDPLVGLYHAPRSAVSDLAPTMADPAAAHVLASVCLAMIAGSAIWALGGVVGAAWMYVGARVGARHQPARIAAPHRR